MGPGSSCQRHDPAVGCSNTIDLEILPNSMVRIRGQMMMRETIPCIKTRITRMKTPRRMVDPKQTDRIMIIHSKSIPFLKNISMDELF